MTAVYQGIYLIFPYEFHHQDWFDTELSLSTGGEEGIVYIISLF